MNRSLFVRTMLFLCLFALPFTFVAGQDAEQVTADYLLFFGGQGGYAGTTEGIRGIATNAAGNILVFDIYGNISEFNMYGELVEVHSATPDGMSFETLFAITNDAEGNVYLAFGETNSIRVYDGDWELVHEYADLDLPNAPSAMGYDDNNDILYTMSYVGEDVFLMNGLDADGENVSEFALPVPEPPNSTLIGGFDVNADGNLVIGFGGYARGVGDLNALEGRIDTFTPDGALLTQWPLAYEEFEEMTTEGLEKIRYFPTPWALVIDDAGNVFSYEVIATSEGTTGVMVVYAANGALLRQFAVSQSDDPWDSKAALSVDGNLLYVATANFVHIISLTEEPPYTTVRMAENGRLRSGPGSEFDVLGSLEAGKTVVVTGANEAGDWLQVRFNGAEAWVADFLTEPIPR